MAPEGKVDAYHAWQQSRKQLALQAWSLESDLKREMTDRSRQETNEFRSFAKKEVDSRKAWEEELWSDLRKLRKQLATLGNNVMTASAEDLRKMVSNMEHKLKVQSEQSRLEFEELCAEENHLEEALEASIARFEAWEDAPAACRSRPSSAPVQRKRERREGKGRNPPRTAEALRGRVEEITQHLANTPRYGGWRPADHDAFLRLLLGRFRGRPTGEFLTEAQQLLPHLAHEQLVEHSKRLLEQDALQAERQSLLQQWRQEQQRPAKPQSLVVEAAKESAQKREADMKKRQSLAEKKKQVEAWQKERAEAARAEQERLREVEEEERRKAQRKQEALQAKKEEMERWRQEKELLRKTEASAAQANATATLSGEQLLRLRARSEQLLRTRERQRAEKLAKTCQRQDLKHASEAYSHVPGRLESSTQQYVLRQRSRPCDEEAWSCRGVMPGNFAHQGLVRTLRTAPAWRVTCS